MLLVLVMWVGNLSIAKAQSSTSNDQGGFYDANAPQGSTLSIGSASGTIDPTLAHNMKEASLKSEDELNSSASSSTTETTVSSTTNVDKLAASKPIPSLNYNGTRDQQMKEWMSLFNKWYFSLPNPTSYLNSEEINLFKSQNWEGLFNYEMPVKK